MFWVPFHFSQKNLLEISFAPNDNAKHKENIGNAELNIKQAQKHCLKNYEEYFLEYKQGVLRTKSHGQSK